MSTSTTRSRQPNLSSVDSIGTENIVINKRTNEIASIVAKSRTVPCVISGETGTGKEEFAKLVHLRREYLEGPRPLVCVNCANINGDLAQSLLFGHSKGAFSGADKGTRGFVGEANGGILFLDEVHALSVPSQQKLLRVMNDGTYNRLGETSTLRSSFQVIAASTKCLDEEVQNGKFIIDLRSRLIGIEVKLPPLREITDRLPELLRCFARLNRIEFSDEIIIGLCRICSRYYWQGNIRQLFAVLGAWLALCQGEPRLDLFPEYRSMLPPGTASPQNSSDEMREIIEIIGNAATLELPLEEAMNTVEHYILRKSLNLHRSVNDICQGLGMSRNNLYLKRRKHGLLDIERFAISMVRG